MKLRKAIKKLFRIIDIPSISYSSVIKNQEIKIIEPVDKPGGLTLEELAIIIGISKRYDNCKIFEIGSFTGRTSINLLHNNPKCYLTTLDLPDYDNIDTKLKFSLLKNDVKIAKTSERGFFFSKYQEFEKRVKILIGDSAVFNFNDEYGKYDMVFIDGSHR
ncbi:hypothetical protein EB822_10765, partial [Flavobacteriaceae bacterium PRS1]